MNRLQIPGGAKRGRPRDETSGPAILEATLELVTEVGIAGLTMDAVARRAGVGRALLAAVRAPGLQVWAHGDGPAARALAESAGLRRGRVLLQMRLDLAHAVVDEVRLPEGISLRAFVVGQDEQSWTALNALAFAAHPEQGAWEVGELLTRERTTWFDPAGFLLAVREDEPGTVAGFHWTKVHAADAERGPLGEVYAVGVAPGHQGTGLGRALTAAGVNHLARQGLDEVMLYVDGDNAAAMRLYDALGFRPWHLDVMYAGTLPG